MKNWQTDFRLKYKKTDNVMEDFFYLSSQNREEAISQLLLIAQTIESLENFSIEEYDPYDQKPSWKFIK